MLILMHGHCAGRCIDGCQVDPCESHGSDKVSKKVEYTHYFQNNLYLLDL